MRCGPQVEEMGLQHFSPPLSKAELKAKVIFFEQVQLPSPAYLQSLPPRVEWWTKTTRHDCHGTFVSTQTLDCR